MKPIDSIELLLTYGELASVVHASERTIRRLVAQGELEAVRLNARVVRVPISAWHRFCEREATLAATRRNCDARAASSGGRA